MVALIGGWWVFSFVCDDAYIAFRYVSSRRLGWGYTWNPPPFRPVEGYTSFLWVALLDLVWTVTGVAPPEAVNAVSLAASLGSLAVIFGLALTTPLSDRLRPWRVPLLALVLLCTLSNRTFLTWTSSGLETALFTLLVLGWVAAGLRGSRGAFALATALLPLTRPDGYLFAAFAALYLGIDQLRRGRPTPRDALPWLAFAVPIAHVAWRRATYGAWLPNTYYAKQVAPWPEAGVRYAASFALEHAGWIWALVAIAWLGRLVRERARPDPARVAVLGAVVGQFAYYTLIVGGDHFEYRVYHHLVPLLALSFVAMLDRIGAGARTTAGALLAMTLLGLPLPWTHWALTHTLDTRDETRMLRVAVAPHLPQPLRLYALPWDGLQRWLVGHWIGMRHQEHKIYALHQLALYPPRDEALGASDLPVFVRSGVGVPGWVMPRVVIIDRLGLNDAVVARSRTRLPENDERRMAHDRKPPKGYVECFRPNVKFGPRRTMIVSPREDPLDPVDVRRCERRFRRVVERASG